MTTLTIILIVLGVLLVASAISIAVWQLTKKEDKTTRRPGAPLTTELVYADGNVVVYFTPPNDDGGSSILYYEATAGEQTSQSETSPITLSDVEPEAEIRLVAENSAGESEPSTPTPTPTPTPTSTKRNHLHDMCGGSGGQPDTFSVHNKPQTAVIK
jgi:hypothetical protein